MVGSGFLRPLSAIFLLCLGPDSAIAAISRPSCITFFFANGDAQSPPTSTVFQSVSTSTSLLPCGSCKLETQAFFPYPFYGYAAIDDAFTTTVTSPLGTSTAYACAPSTSSTKKGIEPPPGTRPTGVTDPASESRRNANTRGSIVTGTGNGPFTPSGFRPSSIGDPSRARSSSGTAKLGSITATRVSILTFSSGIKTGASGSRPPASSGIPKQTTCTTVDPAVPTADCITLSFISGNFTSCTSCPTDPANLSVCQFLCSIPFRAGPILQCSSTNLAGNSDVPHFAAASCQRCLPACEVRSISGRPYDPPASSFVSRQSSSSLVSRLPSSSLVSRLPSSSLISRLPSSSLVSRLPSSSLVSRLPSSSLISRLPSSLISRLPSSSLISRLPSTSLIVSRLPSQSLISRSPSFSPSSHTLSNPNILSLSTSKATLTTSITSSRSRTSSATKSTSSCPVVPAVVDHGDPCQNNFNDDLICGACPTLFEVNIFSCPFLCQITFSYSLSALQCSQYDLTGQNILPLYNGSVQSCQKCLTSCPAPTFIYSPPTRTSTTVRSSTPTSVTSTCSALSPSNTPSPFLITGNEVFYRESCGTSRAESDACPFLCRGSPLELFGRCSPTNESGTKFENLVQVCEECLPPCYG